MSAATYKCGHPRTPENTNKRQCRECKTARQRERYATEPDFAEGERARAAAAYDALEGPAYSLHRLKNRRALARRRHRIRDLRNQEG